MVSERMVTGEPTGKKWPTSQVAKWVAATFLVGGGVVALVWAVRYYSPPQTQMGDGLIPGSALLSVSMSTEPETWQQARQLGTTNTQDQLQKTFQQWRDRLTAATGYNYEQDIQPWVGKRVTLAFLPSEQPALEKTHPSQLAIFPIANRNAFTEMWRSPDKLEKNQWSQRSYQGVTIWEIGSSETTYAAAVLQQRFVVIANQPQTLEKAIDAYQQNTSIADAEGYQQAWKQLPQAANTDNAKLSLARLYVNVPEVAAWLAKISVNSETLPKITQIPQNQGIVGSVALESEGVRLQTLSWRSADSGSNTSTNKKAYLVSNESPSMLSRLSADAVLAVSGNNLQRFWQNYSQRAKLNPLNPLNVEWLRQALQSTVDLNLETDLLPWMDGAFVVSVLPAPQETKSPLPGGVAFLVQTSDRARAETTLSKLDKVITDKYEYNIEDKKINGRSVVNWTSPMGSVTVTYGWLPQDILFFTVGAPIADRVVSSSDPTLPEREVFQKTFPQLERPYNGNFYINIDQTLNSDRPLLPKFPPEQQVWIESLRAIGVTVAVQNEFSTYYDVFLLVHRNHSASNASNDSTETSDREN
jgi:hypothetical protein